MEIINISGIKINIVGYVERITDSIKEELRSYNAPIFWNDSTCKHWMFDFKIDNVWFENAEINNELDCITLYVY